MHRIVFTLVMVFFISLPVQAQQWNYLLSKASKATQLEDQTHSSNILDVVINLRRAWIAVDDPTLKSPAYLKIQNQLSSYFLNHNLESLGSWYKSADLKTIDSKMKEKQLEGNSFFKEKWKARMDEFGLITIWPIETTFRGPKVYYFKPDDEQYSDALALSKLKPGQEKFADFDISALAIEKGPLMSLDW